MSSNGWQIVVEKLSSYEPKALGADLYYNGHTGLRCAVGAVCRCGVSSLALSSEFLKITGLSCRDMTELFEENDRVVHDAGEIETPEQRFTRVLEFARAKAEHETCVNLPEMFPKAEP